MAKNCEKITSGITPPKVTSDRGHERTSIMMRETMIKRKERKNMDMFELRVS